MLCKPHDTRIDYSGESVVRAALSRPDDFSGDRDYILRYRLAGKKIASGLLLHEGEKEKLFVTAPIRGHGEMASVLTVAKPTTNITELGRRLLRHLLLPKNHLSTEARRQ